MKESCSFQDDELARGGFISEENSAMMRTFREKKNRLHDCMTTRSHEAAWRWNDFDTSSLPVLCRDTTNSSIPVFLSSVVYNNRLGEMLVPISRQETGVKIYDS